MQQIDSATNNAVLINNLLQKLSENIEKQAPGIFIEPFELLTNVKTDNKKQLSRIIFKIWPGRNTVLDKNFKQELLDGLKKIEPNYAEWMIANSAEIE